MCLRLANNTRQKLAFVAVHRMMLVQKNYRCSGFGFEDARDVHAAFNFFFEIHERTFR